MMTLRYAVAEQLVFDMLHSLSTKEEVVPIVGCIYTKRVFKLCLCLAFRAYLYSQLYLYSEDELIFFPFYVSICSA